MAILPSSYNSDFPIIDIGNNGFEATTVSNITNDFTLSPDYKSVFLVDDSSINQDFLHDSSLNNSYGLTKYDAWVFDGTEEERTLGHKYIQMYPYSKPVLKEGDYVSFDYYNNGEKSTWLCLALNSASAYEQIAKIRMCSNEVRFYDENHNLVKIPCVFDDKINSKKNTTLANLKYINGITTIYMQNNSDAEKLHPNQRLIFGMPSNWTAFKIVSVGVDNFMNTVYWDNSTAKVLEITMEASYVNKDLDDLINGIADAYSYSVVIDNQNISINTGGTAQVSAAVIGSDGVIINKGLSYKSSDAGIATVNSSGLVTAVSNGSCKIVVYMTENENIYSEVNIIVSNSIVDNYNVVIYPYADDYYGVLQGEKVDFSCFLYNNDVKLEDTFTFVLTTDIPDNYYKFSVIDGNNFSVSNIHMDYSNLNVLCSSGSYSFNAVIKLKGAW